MKLRFSFLLLILFLSPAWSYGKPIVDRFHQVDERLYRGAQPDSNAMLELKRFGIDKIINLRTTDSWVNWEGEVADHLNIQYEPHPIQPWSAPSDRTLTRILRAMKGSDGQTVFIHCQHGKDRTGLMVGLYRVVFQGWDPREAWNEMRRIGFQPLLLGLSHSFWDYSL